MWTRQSNPDTPDPFGRNPAETQKDQLYAESTKCPSCASNLFYQPEVHGMMCRYCGNVYDPSTLEKIESFGYSIEHDYTADSDVSEEDRKRHEIVCSSCGAVMIADGNMMSTMCVFCGSPALITRRMTREFKPDYIVPFKIDKQTADNSMMQWIKTRKINPKGFRTKSRLIGMIPIYVPFWLLDCAVNTDMYGIGKRISRDRVTESKVRSKVKYYVKGVPFDASLKIANKLMEAIEPFDYSEMVKFHKRYLQGFYADKYDQRPTEMIDRFIKRLDRISLDMNGTISAKFDGYEPAPEKNFTWMSELSIKYCLLPVWFMTVEFDGRNYQFAVNGQTGEAGGQAPTSGAVEKLDTLLYFSRGNWRRIPVCAAVVIPVLIFLMTFSRNTGPLFYTLFLILCFVELLLAGFLITVPVLRRIAERTSRRIHETIDEVNEFDKAPGTNVYLDTTRCSELKVDEYTYRFELDDNNKMKE